MRYLISLAIAAVGMLSFTANLRAADPFEGLKWKVKYTASPNSDFPNDKGFDDTLIFKGSKFSTAEFVKKGFAPVDFDQRSTRGPMAGFQAEQKSDKEGKLVWNGTTTGMEMTGEVTWTKKDGSVHRYDFKGEKQR